jgi:glutamate carboxypeptidase
MYGLLIEEYLNKKLPEMLSLLENLVNRNTSSDYKPGVDEAGAILEEEFQKIGYSTEILNRDHVGNSVIARKKGNGKAALLICHIDSVFSEGTDYIKPFSIEGNIARGNGVVDMKACLVTSIYALKALEELRIPDVPDITVFMSGDEEKGSEAVRENIENEGRKSDWTLVTEGSRPGMAIVSQRKGNAYLKVRVKGRAAHAGNEPHIGRNSIVELARKIERLDSLNDFEKGTTVSVTLIRGGENRIVIPDYAEISVDIRFYTMDEWNKVEKAIKEILSATETNGVELEYDLVFNRPPLSLVPGSDSLLKIVEEASAELNIPFLQVSAGGVSDGNFITALGVPAVDGMGPTGGMMCSPEEYLEVDTMVPCAARLALTLAKLGVS